MAAQVKPVSAVVITQNMDVDKAITTALKQIPLEPVIKGKLVAVKPNDTWASKDDISGVTQPDTLRALLRYLKTFGPRELVVTGGSGAGETEEVFRVAGLMDVLETEGVQFFDHNRPPFIDVALDYGSSAEVQGPQKTVKVNPRVLEYDTLISLCQLKLHETATVTLSLKNMAMSFPAADYYGHPRHSQKHPNEFFADMHSLIAAMAKRFHIDLAIIVGHPAMIASGPLGGYPVETGLVIASTDALAADVVGARLLGFRAQGVRHLWEAGKLGLGQTDTDEMRFPAMGLEEAIRAFTLAAYGRELNFEHA
jgi:uncharacterized protein (DUF362 family)